MFGNEYNRQSFDKMMAEIDRLINVVTTRNDNISMLNGMKILATLHTIKEEAIISRENKDTLDKVDKRINLMYIYFNKAFVDGDRSVGEYNEKIGKLEKDSENTYRQIDDLINEALSKK